LPAGLEPAIARALGAAGTPVDLGRAGQTPFGGIAGVGIVADVLSYLAAFTRRYRGNWVYPWAVLRTVLRFRPIQIRLDSADGDYTGPAMIAVAANAPRFGGGMRVAPEASMHDGLLDVVLLTGTSRLALIRLLPRVYRGTHLSDPACTLFRTREVRITSAVSAVVHADGEALPEDTVSETVFTAEKDAIRVAI
jgi:diacylglycerol kinase family enzyme